MKNYHHHQLCRLPCLFQLFDFFKLAQVISVFLVCSFFALWVAQAFAADDNVEKELQVAAQCCAASGISYCDISAGHYVCKNGTYSACICSQQTSVSAHPITPMGCCLWHGGVMQGTLGQVVCRDGSVSEVCGDQSLLDHLN